MGLIRDFVLDFLRIGGGGEGGFALETTIFIHTAPFLNGSLTSRDHAILKLTNYSLTQS